MTESILDTIKQMLGIPAEDTAFDEEIMVNINSSIMVLEQLGVGPETPIAITDNSTVWSDLVSDTIEYSAVKTFIYLSVKLVFDPPATSFVLESLSRQKDEFAWRLSV